MQRVIQQQQEATVARISHSVAAVCTSGLPYYLTAVCTSSQACNETTAMHASVKVIPDNLLAINGPSKKADTGTVCIYKLLRRLVVCTLTEMFVISRSLTKVVAASWTASTLTNQ